MCGFFSGLVFLIKNLYLVSWLWLDGIIVLIKNKKFCLSNVFISLICTLVLDLGSNNCQTFIAVTKYYTIKNIIICVSLRYDLI